MSDKENMMTAGEEVLQRTLAPMCEALTNAGITTVFLARKLKKELNAKKTVFQKIKGAANLPVNPKTGKPKKNIRIIAGNTPYPSKPQIEYDDGSIDIEGGRTTKPVGLIDESIIAIDTIDFSTRQKARQDAHKLLNHYPADKVEVGGVGGQPLYDPAALAPEIKEVVRRAVIEAGMLARGKQPDE